MRFHVEHVYPKSLGGMTDISNLAFSCPGCNLTKLDRLEGTDDKGETHPLFNPREYDPWVLGWHLHFALNLESGIIVPRTSVGEATVNCLQMNEALRVFGRNVQIYVGLLS